MYRNLLLCLLALTLSYSSSAGEKGKIGLTVDLKIEGGFLNPKINEFMIREVISDSPAEKAGIRAGQKVLSIDGCVIPDCSARRAKKLMEKE